MQHRYKDEERRKILADNIRYFLNLEESERTPEERKFIDIAKEIGVTSRQLLRYKTGECEPTALVLFHLCLILGIDIQRMLMTKEEYQAYIEDSKTKVWVSNEKGPICAVVSADTIEEATDMLNHKLPAGSHVVGMDELSEFETSTKNVVVMADIGDY